MKQLLLTSLVGLSLVSTTMWAAKNQPQSDSDVSAKPSQSAANKQQSTQAPSSPANDSQSEDDAIFKQIDTFQSKQPQHDEADPLEGYNRWMTKVNDHLDRLVAKPLAELYVHTMPDPLETLVNNAYSNLDYIPTVANDVLQANLYQATSDSWRFIINSTIGLGGLFDVASHMGLAENHQTFGLTLARWGWENSTYFVLPIFGPSTIRDAAGKPVTLLTSIYPFMESTSAEWGLYAGSLLNRRVQMLKLQGVMNQASLDRYSFLKNAYLQRQKYLIDQNEEHDIPYSAKQTRYYAQPNYLYR